MFAKIQVEEIKNEEGWYKLYKADIGDYNSRDCCLIFYCFYEGRETSYRFSDRPELQNTEEKNIALVLFIFFFGNDKERGKQGREGGIWRKPCSISMGHCNVWLVKTQNDVLNWDYIDSCFV